MNQSNSANKYLQEEEVKLHEKLKEDPFFNKMVKEMIIDYVVNSLSVKMLAEKYHVSETLAKKISNKFKFEDKKKEYDKKLLDTVLAKAQKQQAGIIAKITLAINEQVNRLIKKQSEDPDYIISNNHMKDLISSLTVFSKEYRLDNDKMTESLGLNVRVEFPAHVPIVTQNHNKKYLEAEVVKDAEEVKEIIQEEKKEEPETFSLDDDEPSGTSNKTFFGMIE